MAVVNPETTNLKSNFNSDDYVLGYVGGNNAIIRMSDLQASIANIQTILATGTTTAISLAGYVGQIFEPEMFGYDQATTQSGRDAAYAAMYEAAYAYRGTWPAQGAVCRFRSGKTYEVGGSVPIQPRSLTTTFAHGAEIKATDATHDAPIIASYNYWNAGTPGGFCWWFGGTITGTNPALGVTPNQHGILLMDYWCWFEGVTTYKVGGAGIYLSHRDRFGATVTGTLVNNRICKNTFWGSNSYGAYLGLTDTNKITDGFFEDNYVVLNANVTDDAIFCGHAAGWFINRNHTYGGLPVRGIYAKNLFGTSINDNYIEVATDYGILLNAVQFGGVCKGNKIATSHGNANYRAIWADKSVAYAKASCVIADNIFVLWNSAAVRFIEEYVGDGLIAWGNVSQNQSATGTIANIDGSKIYGAVELKTEANRPGLTLSQAATAGSVIWATDADGNWAQYMQNAAGTSVWVNYTKTGLVSYTPNPSTTFCYGQPSAITPNTGTADGMSLNGAGRRVMTDGFAGDVSCRRTSLGATHDLYYESGGVTSYKGALGVSANGPGLYTSVGTLGFDVDSAKRIIPRGADVSASGDWGTITDGGSAVIGSVSWNVFRPSSLLATYTITMPASPTDGQLVIMQFGAFGVTALTVSPNAGQTLRNAPTAAASDQCFKFRYLAATATWYREQ